MPAESLENPSVEGVIVSGDRHLAAVRRGVLFGSKDPGLARLGSDGTAYVIALSGQLTGMWNGARTRALKSWPSKARNFFAHP